MKKENLHYKLSLDEIKNIEYNILVFIDKLCKDNNIQYFLAYGTLLGAIRHKGFIPWDDDIDIMMSRPNFNRLIKIFKDNNYKYRMISSEINENYYAPLAKIYDPTTLLVQHYGQIEKPPIGAYVDVFIIDGLPENPKERKDFYNHSKKIRKEWYWSCRKFFAKRKSFLRFIVGGIISIPYRLIGYRHYVSKYNSFCSKYNYNTSKYVGVVQFGEGEKKETFPKSLFDNPIDVEFCNNLFPAPSYPEIYLSQVYGNYMELPPIEQRVSKHSSSIYKLKEEKMKKVGILTFHRATNYGALLQAYSLIIKLKNDYPNISFELVDYSTMVASIDHFKTVVKPLLSGNLKASYAEFNKNRILSKFSASLPRSKKRILSDKIEKISAYINNTYDAILVGSDAVFSWRNKAFPTIYLLKDVKKPIKLSYAASAHRLHYKNASKDVISYCNEAFSSFDYLGVRDNETEKFVKYCAPHVKLHHNCDPTIFFDLESIRNEKNNVCKKLSKLKLDKNKPLMLIMSPDEKIGNYIVREYSKHYNIVSLFVPNKAIDKSIMNLTPFEWANVFSFAQFVVTEYFHGTIFSLKNGIPTLSIDKTSANSGYEGKIKDLLVRRLQLHEIYLNIDDICLEGYDIIKNRIENISRNFCKNSVFNAIIEEGKEYDTFTHSFEALLLK